MASCESCWAEAGGDADEYARLLKARTCGPEQQAGPDATLCPECRRRTVHQHARICMSCGTDYGSEERAHPETCRCEACRALWGA
jgi:hypothetical protein